MLPISQQPLDCIGDAQQLQGQLFDEPEDEDGLSPRKNTDLLNEEDDGLSPRKNSFKVYSMEDFVDAGLLPERLDAEEARSRRPTVHSLIDFEACNQLSGDSSGSFGATDSDEEAQEECQEHSWEEMPDEEVWKHISLAERRRHSHAAANMLARRLGQQFSRSILLMWRFAIKTQQMQERIAALENESAQWKLQALSARRDTQEACPELVPELSPERSPECAIQSMCTEKSSDDIALDNLQLQRCLQSKPFLPPYMTAVCLNGFLAFWTGSMLALRSPRMAFFSLPFWVQGVQLLQRTMRPKADPRTLRTPRRPMSAPRQEDDRDETESLHSVLHQAEAEYTAITQLEITDTASPAPEVSTEGVHVSAAFTVPMLNFCGRVGVGGTVSSPS